MPMKTASFTEVRRRLLQRVRASVQCDPTGTPWTESGMIGDVAKIASISVKWCERELRGTRENLPPRGPAPAVRSGWTS